MKLINRAGIFALALALWRFRLLFMHYGKFVSLMFYQHKPNSEFPAKFFIKFSHGKPL